SIRRREADMCKYLIGAAYLAMAFVLCAGSTLAAERNAKEPVQDGKTLSEWVKALKEGDREAREQAANALAKLGPKAEAAIPVLLQALKGDDVTVQFKAGDALAAIGKAAVPGLTEALKDSNVHVREHAAAALGKIGPEAKAALKVLIERMEDDD